MRPLLWSFEGVRASESAATRLTVWAVIAAGKHLFPFRTEKLSPLAPMVLGKQSPGRVGRRPFLRQAPEGGPVAFPVSGGSEVVAPVRVELAQFAHPLADRRMRDEQRGEPFVREGIR